MTGTANRKAADAAHRGRTPSLFGNAVVGSSEEKDESVAWQMTVVHTPLGVAGTRAFQATSAPGYADRILTFSGQLIDPCRRKEKRRMESAVTVRKMEPTDAPPAAGLCQAPEGAGRVDAEPCRGARMVSVADSADYKG